jgi:hypothetical protein
MTRFEEGHLTFEFGERWEVCKLDDHPDYRNRIENLDGTKAVDFLGILDETELYFIEVKDFRGHRIENKERLSQGELPIEVGQKVRDSLACIIAAYHTSSTPEDWQPFANLLCKRQSSIKVVIWLEYGPLPTYPRQKQKTFASISTKKFKQKLTWLTNRVQVCQLDINGLPDVTVSNLPRP